MKMNWSLISTSQKLMAHCHSHQMSKRIWSWWMGGDVQSHMQKAKVKCEWSISKKYTKDTERKTSVWTWYGNNPKKTLIRKSPERPLMIEGPLNSISYILHRSPRGLEELKWTMAMWKLQSLEWCFFLLILKETNKNASEEPHTNNIVMHVVGV